MPLSQNHYQHPDSCIVMFARAPVLGQVKTRLIPALGEQGALDMHLQLMNRQIEVLNQSQQCAKQLWVDLDIEHPAFKNFDGEVKLQVEGSLGDKMCHAAQKVLQQFSKVVLIGSDCPALDEDYLQQALHSLGKNAMDVVLGPALDGGYVLIAMKKVPLEVFQDISWGSELVLEQTINKLNAGSLKFSMLSPLMDIDTPEDLKDYNPGG